MDNNDFDFEKYLLVEEGLDSIEPTNTEDDTDSTEGASEPTITPEDTTLPPTTPTTPVESSIFDVFVENGILSLPENFEFDGSEDSILKLIEHSTKVQQEKAQEELMSKFPPDTQRLIQYSLNGGDINEFFNTAQQFDDLSNVDITTSENQRKVLEHYYKTTSKHDDDRIKRIIDKLESTGVLEESALEAVEDLQDLKEQKLQEMIDKREQDKIDQEKRITAYTESITKTLEESQLDITTKSKIKSLIFDPVKTQDGVVNKYYLTLSQIEKNPQHLVQLSELLADYDPEKGLQLTTIKQQANKKGLDQVKNLLQRNLNNSNPPKGSSSQSSGSNFNFEDFVNS